MKTLINGVKALKDGDANSFDLVKFINRNIVSGKIKAKSSGLTSATGIYNLGDSNTLPITVDVPETIYNLVLNQDGIVKKNTLNAYFLSKSVLSPITTIDHYPHPLEIATYIATLSTSAQEELKNRILYFTNSTNAAHSVNAAWFYTQDGKVIELYRQVPAVFYQFGYVTGLTSSSNGSIISTISLNTENYANSTNLVSIRVECKIGVGTGTFTIKQKDGSSLATISIDAVDGGGTLNLGGVMLHSNNGRQLLLEATTITGNIDQLSVTIALQ